MRYGSGYSRRPYGNRMGYASRHNNNDDNVTIKMMVINVTITMMAINVTITMMTSNHVNLDQEDSTIMVQREWTTIDKKKIKKFKTRFLKFNN